MLERPVARRPRLALKLSTQELGIASVCLRLEPSSPLFRAGVAETVELPLDDVMSPYVMDYGRWQPEELRFVETHLPEGDCVLVDVGANIGLITRQLVHSIPRIAAAVCVEPHPGNFAMLTRNLVHLPLCRLIQAAMGTQDGELRFYEDLRNAGNYSLHADAMRGTSYRTTIVNRLKATEDRLLAELPAPLRQAPILWKSDTQGCDEAIAVTLPDDFSNRVHSGVMEICRIDKPSFDRERFGQILERFSVRRFGDEPDKNLSINQILEFAGGTDYRYADLYFSRT